MQIDTWQATRRDRLASAGFGILDDVPFEGRSFRFVAQRSRLELSKCGFAETFFVFGEFDELTIEMLRQFSADAFRFAKKYRSIPLPCGFFESVTCYAVAVARAVDEETLMSVQLDTPPLHLASVEMPVVYDQCLREVFYFVGMPFRGWIYYPGFRAEIRRLIERD